MMSKQNLITLYAVFGVCALLVQALVRLTPRAVEAFTSGDMTTLQWFIALVWVVFNAHAEGYRGFQGRFNPRVIARAWWLAEHPRPLFVLFAPLFVMSLFHAARRERIVAWSIVIGVTILILIVRTLDQPWRGIIDAGVVVGLGWGMLDLLRRYAIALVHGPGDADPALPD